LHLALHCHRLLGSAPLAPRPPAAPQGLGRTAARRLGPAAVRGLPGDAPAVTAVRAGRT
jgi:hypothetical protein